MEFAINAESEVNSGNSNEMAQAFLDSERGNYDKSLFNKNAEAKNVHSDNSYRSDLYDNAVAANESLNSSEINDKQTNSNNSNENVLHEGSNSLNEVQHQDQIKANSDDTTFSDKEKFNSQTVNDFKTNESISVNGKNKSNELDETSAILKAEIESEVLNNEEEEWVDILGSGQLKKKVLKPGVPDTRPQKSDVCEIRLIGKLEDGTIFEEHKCLVINLGDNETVQGLDFVLALMDKGEEAEVIVASRFGYGSLGLKPSVPPDATLTFNISLLNVEPEPLISDLDINERIRIGTRKKERGNWWYSRDEHTLAIHSYRRALDYLDDTDIPGEHTEEQVRLLLDERLKTYNNLGASQLKISAYDAALLSIDKVLNCQPRNVKALFRKSKILKEKGELTRSIEVIKEALAIEPDSKSFQQELSLLLAMQRKDNSKQRDLYKKMMGHNRQEDESDKKKNAQSNAFKWIAAVSFAVAIIGAVVFKYRLKNFK